MDQIPNITPGEILKEEFLLPMGISAYKLAKDTNMTATRISEILKGRRRITADTALEIVAVWLYIVTIGTLQWQTLRLETFRILC